MPPVAPPKSEAEDAAAAAAVAIYQKAQRESLQAHKQAVAEKPTLQLSRSEGDADPSPRPIFWAPVEHLGAAGRIRASARSRQAEARDANARSGQLTREAQQRQPEPPAS